MTVTAKQIKTEILTAAAKEVPPANVVESYGIMDMAICDYYNKSSRAPKELTLGALTAAATLGDGLDISTAEVKSILDKHQGQDVVCSKPNF